MSSKVPSDNMSEQMRSYITDQLFFSSGAVSLTNEELQNMAFGPINLTNMRQFDQSRPNSSERASGSSRHSVETNDSPVLESSIVSNDEIEKAIAIETLEYSPRKAVKNGKNKVQEVKHRTIMMLCQRKSIFFSSSFSMAAYSIVCFAATTTNQKRCTSHIQRAMCLIAQFVRNCGRTFVQRVA